LLRVADPRSGISRDGVGCGLHCPLLDVKAQFFVNLVLHRPASHERPEPGHQLFEPNHNLTIERFTHHVSRIMFHVSRFTFQDQFHVNHIKPAAELETDLLEMAHFPESKSRVKRNTGGLLAVNASDDRAMSNAL
jgi:hypothetical protein